MYSCVGSSGMISRLRPSVVSTDHGGKDHPTSKPPDNLLNGGNRDVFFFFMLSIISFIQNLSLRLMILSIPSRNEFGPSFSDLMCVRHHDSPI